MLIADPEIARTLREFICRDLLNDPTYPLRNDAPLVSGGLIDSFMVAHLAVFIEQTFGVHLPDVILLSEEVDTVERIVAVIQAAR